MSQRVMSISEWKVHNYKLANKTLADLELGALVGQMRSTHPRKIQGLAPLEGGVDDSPWGQVVRGWQYRVLGHKRFWAIPLITTVAEQT